MLDEGFPLWTPPLLLLVSPCSRLIRFETTDDVGVASSAVVLVGDRIVELPSPAGFCAPLPDRLIDGGGGNGIAGRSIVIGNVPWNGKTPP